MLVLKWIIKVKYQEEVILLQILINNKPSEQINLKMRRAFLWGGNPRNLEWTKIASLSNKNDLALNKELINKILINNSLILHKEIRIMLIKTINQILIELEPALLLSELQMDTLFKWFSLAFLQEREEEWM